MDAFADWSESGSCSCESCVFSDVDVDACASSQPPRVDDPLAGLSREQVIAHYSAVSATSEAMGCSAAAAKVKRENTERTSKETEATRLTRVLSDDYLNAALAGQHLKSGARRAEHPVGKCKHSKGECACWEGLWTRGDLQQHLAHFETVVVEGKTIPVKQEVRSETVYSTIDGMFFRARGADGSSELAWHFYVKGQEVCREVFLWYYPVGSSTL